MAYVSSAVSVWRIAMQQRTLRSCGARRERFVSCSTDGVRAVVFSRSLAQKARRRAVSRVTSGNSGQICKRRASCYGFSFIHIRIRLRVRVTR
jgi:hypothetical protein